MRRFWMLLGVAMLAGVLAIGAVACGDDDDDGNGDEPAATEEQMDATATEEMMEPTSAGEEPTAAESATVIVTDGILTDADGNTLYVFDNDEAGLSNCFEACADTWPPLASDAPTAGEGMTGTLSTTDRQDGITQVTYNDQPLYYYAADSNPGDRTGDGVGGVWHIVVVE